MFWLLNSFAQALLQKLEMIPPLQTPEGQAVDLDAILRRAPRVCVIDPLAAQNPPGSRHSNRVGLDSHQALGRRSSPVGRRHRSVDHDECQHIESLNDQVWQITGIQVRETVPDGIVRQAGKL